MPLRLHSDVPSYPMRSDFRLDDPQNKPPVFIPAVGGSAPIGKLPVGLPAVGDDGVARIPFEKEGHPVRNFFAHILYSMGVVLRSGR